MTAGAPQRAMVRRARSLEGELYPPPDKSISHRAAILLALAEGTGVVTNFLRSRDTLATVACLRALGVAIDEEGSDLLVRGAGSAGLREPEDVLDAANSGTTMRLLAGVLAGQPFLSVVTGDRYLRRRPMRRVIEPLGLMGATVLSRTGGLAPLAIAGGRLRGIDYELPVASAQVKSCVLLAGLFAEGVTTVRERFTTRDHTERLLAYLGADVRRSDGRVSLRGGAPLEARPIAVPGDISSAAFFAVAAAIVPGSDVVMRNVGLNESRAGVLAVLARSGASVIVEPDAEVAGEPAGTVRVAATGRLGAFEVGAAEVPLLVDEIPVLAVAATQAEGTTVISGAQELRVKESDRLHAMAVNLRAMGATVEERPDGLVIDGPTRLRGAVVRADGDHRVAMALAIAGLVAEGETVIEDADCVAVSYPSFFEDLDRLARWA